MLENENNIQEETAFSEEASAGIADAAEETEVSQERVDDSVQSTVNSVQSTVNSEQITGDSEQEAREDGRIRDVLDQAVALAEKIPGFDLALEMKDPVFGHLVYAGVPVEQAFMVTHMDLLMDVMAKNIARDTEARISASIASGMTRPVENTESAPVQPQHDIRDKAYRDEIKKRVFEASVRGEKVYPE